MLRFGSYPSETGREGSGLVATVELEHDVVRFLRRSGGGAMFEPAECGIPGFVHSKSIGSPAAPTWREG